MERPKVPNEDEAKRKGDEIPSSGLEQSDRQPRSPGAAGESPKKDNRSSDPDSPAA